MTDDHNLKANLVNIIRRLSLIPTRPDRRIGLLLIATILSSSSAVHNSFAGSAKWGLSPADGNWNNSVNWSPATVPNGSSDIATFGHTANSHPYLGANAEVSGISFVSDGSSGVASYTINVGFGFALTLSGAGITNTPGVTQNFAASAGTIAFVNSATAGTQTIFTNGAAKVSGGAAGITQFLGSASARSATFNNVGSSVSPGSGGQTLFYDSSTAGNGAFVNGGGTYGGSSGGTAFYGNSVASGTFTNNGGTASGAYGGNTSVLSTANGATFVNNPGLVAGAYGGETDFGQSAKVSGTTITNNGGTVGDANAGRTAFDADAVTVSTDTITNNAGSVGGAYGGTTYFFVRSSAGNAKITNKGSTFNNTPSGPSSSLIPESVGPNVGITVSSRDYATFTEFDDSATAATATITSNGGTVSGAAGGSTRFHYYATAGNATLIANGGTNGGGGGEIVFDGNSAGGGSRVKVSGNGYLDVSGGLSGAIIIGSLEGNGRVFAGGMANGLGIGASKRSTVFSGVIQDGGLAGGTGAVLFKQGAAKLTLTNANTYTGGTYVYAGTLLVQNTTGSALGPGAVRVSGGTLGGTGKIAGAVTIHGITSAVLLGGNSVTAPGTLTINSALTFTAPASYKCALNRSTLKASTIAALGVIINSNVKFSFVDNGTTALPHGTAFKVINNTSANPIAGTFSNLADGSTFTSNGTTFKANYRGGDGNDLTLIVQ